jgi:surface polysaccharide O-acyltransferase-like enzyme
MTSWRVVVSNKLTCQVKEKKKKVKKLVFLRYIFLSTNSTNIYVLNTSKSLFSYSNTTFYFIFYF